MRIMDSKRVMSIVTTLCVAAAMMVTISFASPSKTASTTKSTDIVRMSVIDHSQTTTTSTTTTTIDPEIIKAQIRRDVLLRSYAWGEQSVSVSELQVILGVAVDGLYGKATRAAHVAALQEDGLAETGVPPVPPSDQSYGHKQCPQWESLAISVGWPPEQIEKFSYVLYRESTCRENSHNQNDPTWAGSRGLMQINGYWCIPNKYNPIGWLQEQGILSTCDDLFIPEVNLRAGLAIWQRSGWGPWGL